MDPGGRRTLPASDAMRPQPRENDYLHRPSPFSRARTRNTIIPLARAPAHATCVVLTSDFIMLTYHMSM